MNETAIRGFTPMPEPVLASTPLTMPLPATLPLPTEQATDRYEPSGWLAAITEGDALPSSARRAGVGLALTLPFAAAVGLRTHAPLGDAIVAGLGLPVGLALIALVGVAASTLGVSLASAPLSPTEAASIASRGLFRAGVLLTGLAPVTALWVAGGRFVEGLLASTLVLATAGASGIGTIAYGLVSRTAQPSGDWRPGAAIVALLFCGFALVVGLRVWIGTAAMLVLEVD